jgi:peptidylprolyl isomerase
MSINFFSAARMVATLCAALMCACASTTQTPAAEPIEKTAPAPYRSAGEIIAAAPDSEWREIGTDDLLVMRLDAGDVLIELAPQFAPQLIANLKTLIRQRYFDDLMITRSQDNFVVQWGDPAALDESDAGKAKRKSLGDAKTTVPAEFERSSEGLPFVRLPDTDGFAPQVGFSDGFAVGHDPQAKLSWLTHCYGVIGAGRDVAADSGNGAELYVVTGHAPRQLDRNITTFGRVVKGMELLATRVRGPQPMGFYTDEKQRSRIQWIRLASELPSEEQPKLKALRTDSQSFADVIEARRNRRDGWYKRPAGYIDICNVPLPVK